MDIRVCKLTQNKTVASGVAAPEIFGYRGTARALEFRLGHLQKVMHFFLISSLSYTVYEWWYTW